jgi:hypothetical protein
MIMQQHLFSRVSIGTVINRELQSSGEECLIQVTKRKMILIPCFSIREFDLIESHENNFQALNTMNQELQSGIQFQRPSNLQSD